MLMYFHCIIVYCFLCVFNVVLFKSGNTMKWKELKWDSNDSVNPPKTKGSSMNYYNGQLWLVGGYNGKPLQRIVYSSVYVYNIKGNKWKEIKNMDNSVYVGLAFHKTVLYQDRFLVFGGSEYDSKWMDKNELYCYDLDGSHEWNIIKLHNKPKEMIKHGMVIYQDLLVIFGGIVEQNVDPKVVVLNSFYLLNMKECLNVNKKNVSWIKLDVDMQCVYSHVMVHNPYSHNIMCFGGSYDDNRNGLRSNDLNLFYNIEAELPQYQLLSILTSGYMRQYYDMLSIIGIWIKIQHFTGLISFKYNIKNITKRAGHNGCILTINNDPNLFVFGGYDGNSCLKDGYFISL